MSEIRKNLITIEKKMMEQKELMLRELKETRETIEHQIHEFQVAFDTEKLEARKREEQAQKRLQSSLSKMQERIDIHRGAMESRIKQVRAGEGGMHRCQGWERRDSCRQSLLSRG